MTSNTNTENNGYSADQSLTEFAWDFPQDIIKNKIVIFNSIITPTKITLKNNKTVTPASSYGKCFVMIDKSQMPSGANEATFIQNNKVAITGGQSITYDSISPTFVESFSEIEKLHFPNAFGHLTGTVYNYSSNTVPYVLINGTPIISLTDYLKLSGFTPTASDGWYTVYSGSMTSTQFVNATGNTLAPGIYQNSIGNVDLWKNNVAPVLQTGTFGNIVIPIESEITVDLYCEKTNNSDQQLQNSGIAYSTWSAEYLGYEATRSKYIVGPDPYFPLLTPQTNNIDPPQSAGGIVGLFSSLYYIAVNNGNGVWNTGYFPSSGEYSNGTVTFNGQFSLNSVNYTSNYQQEWNQSTVTWSNQSKNSWSGYVTDTGMIYPNYTLDDIYLKGIAGSNDYNYNTFKLNSNGFQASFISPVVEDGKNPPLSTCWNANSDGITGGSGSWLLNSPTDPSFLLSGYYYSVTWSTSTTPWNMLIFGPYPALTAVTFNQFANNQYINTAGQIVQINIPIVNYVSYTTTERNLTDSGVSDLEKIANKYYSITDTMVQAYYNHCLQVVHYLLTMGTVSNNQQNLVNYLNIATSYNLLEPMITEWIKEYPVTSIPQATQAIYSSIGDNSSVDDINTMISNFFSTVIPNGVNGVTLCTTSESPSDNYAAQVVTPNYDIQGVTLMPDALRFILSNSMAMGVLLEHLSSQCALLKHLQSSLSSIGNGGSLPTNEMSLNAQQTQVASLVTHVMQSQYNNTQKSSSINPSLIYPELDEVTSIVMTKVEGIRDLIIDRIFGLNEDLFNEELKNIISNFSQEVHALLMDFCNIVTTSMSYITPKYPAVTNIIKAVSNTVISDLSHPIAFSLSLVTRLVADVIGDVSSLLSPGSEILTLFEDANILRPIPVALTPTEKHPIFSYAVSATEQQFTNIDWWGIDYKGNLLSLSNAPDANDVSTEYYGSFTISGGKAKPWSKYIQLQEGVYKQTLLTIGGLVDVWMSGMWEVCSDGQYHRTGNPSIYFVPHPAVDIDGRISIPKSFHKFITVGLLSAGLLYGTACIDAAAAVISEMSGWSGFENYKSHISINAVASAEIADAGAATIATSLGVADLFDNAAGAKEEFTIAAEDAVNAVKVGFVYSRAAAMNVFNSVQQNLQQVKTFFNSIYSSDEAPSGSYLLNFNQSATQMNVLSAPLPLYYKESGAYLFGDVVFSIAKVSSSLWVQHRIFKHFSDLATKKKEDDIKKDAVLGTLGSFALNKYHRIVNNDKRKKELDAQSKKINAAFMNEPLYEQLAQRDLSGMSKQELSDLKSNESSLSKIISDMADDVSSRGLN